MWTHVEGAQGRDLKLFALSTCGWCRKTKELLEERGVAYDFVYVDLLEGEERKNAIGEMEGYTERMAFPLLVVDASDVVQGFDEAAIRGYIDGQ